VKKLEETLERTLKDKETREKLEKMGYKIDFMNGKATQGFSKPKPGSGLQS